MAVQAPVFSNVDIALGVSSGRLKCSATGDPAPTLFWIQPNGRTTKYSPSTAASVATAAAAPVGLGPKTQPVSEAPDQPAPAGSDRLAPAAAVPGSQGPAAGLSGAVEDGARRTDGVLVLNGGRSFTDSLQPSGMYICVANNEAGNGTLAVNLSWPLQSLLFRPPPAPRHNDLADSPSGLPLNLTVLEDELSRRRGEVWGEDTPRLFSVTELVCAVLVTHVATLLIVLALVAIFVQRRAARRRRQQQLLPAVHSTPAPCSDLPPDPRLLGATDHVSGGVGVAVGSTYRHNGFQKYAVR